MLIGFLGAPQSGKTTVAMGLSYHLKLLGHPVEYLPENVRDYFTRMRHQGQTLVEKDFPQHEFYNAEKNRQFMYKEVLPDSIVIADVICAIGEIYGAVLTDVAVGEDLKKYDMIFFCPLPTNINAKTIQKDPNRIHARHQLAGFHQKAVELIERYDVSGIVQILDQPTAQERVDAAVMHVADYLDTLYPEKQYA